MRRIWDRCTQPPGASTRHIGMDPSHLIASLISFLHLILSAIHLPTEWLKMNLVVLVNTCRQYVTMARRYGIPIHAGLTGRVFSSVCIKYFSCMGAERRSNSWICARMKRRHGTPVKTKDMCQHAHTDRHFVMTWLTCFRIRLTTFSKNKYLHDCVLFKMILGTTIFKIVISFA